MPSVTCNDSDLVTRSLSGDREAFGQIVERYQSLVCSLAYSATGSLTVSEDLAQETFLAAWKQLRDLREPQKLRAWICGIARNLIHSTVRREGREPLHSSETLDDAPDAHSPEPMPAERAILNEEAQILWRSLEKIPPAYREPLILFYREHQSAAKVAEAMDLSEEAVHQRLSRGRKLLQEQVLSFVEGALERTNPGKAFTLGVLATLPGLSLTAKAATLSATAAKGGTVAKSVGAAGFLAWLGPLLVILPNYLGYRLALADADSELEKYHIKKFYGRVALIVFALFVPYAGFAWWISSGHEWTLLSCLLIAGLIAIFVPTMFILGNISAVKRRAYVQKRLAVECDGVYPPAVWEYKSRLSLLGLPLIHIRAGDRFSMLKEPVKAWIAMGDRAIGGLFAFGALAVAPVSLGGFALGIVSCGGGSLGIFSIGGIAAGVWTFFGGVSLGWQAMGACAIALHTATGGVAIALQFASGGLAMAPQANNPAVWRSLDASLFFRAAHWLNNHWMWLNLLWIVPYFVQWRVIALKRRHAANKP